MSFKSKTARETGQVKPNLKPSSTRACAEYFRATEKLSVHADTLHHLEETLPQLTDFEYLANGGCGIVYKANHKHLQRQVAIKIVASDSEDPEQFSRLQREAYLMSSLEHRNIAKVYDFVKADEEGFIVLEYIEGQTLHSLIQNRYFDNHNDIIFIFRQIIAALTYAHSKSIIHRDLKPSNILVTPQKTVKLIDFGIARPKYPTQKCQVITKTCYQIGTPRYMAPEQLSQNFTPNEQLDIYSLGIITKDLLDLFNTTYCILGIQFSLRTLPIASRYHRLSKLSAQATNTDPKKRIKTAKSFSKRFEHAIRSKKTNTRKNILYSLLILTLLFAHQNTRKLLEDTQRIEEPSQSNYWKNSLGMEFVQHSSLKIKICRFETRQTDYRYFASQSLKANKERKVLTLLPPTKGNRNCWRYKTSSWNKLSSTQASTHPIAGISYSEAILFCTWLTKAERIMGVISDDEFYRLPYIDEWFSFADLKERYPWGNNWKSSYDPISHPAFNLAGHEMEGDPAWWPGFRFLPFHRDTHRRTNPVKYYAPDTKTHLFGIIGNVSEWCTERHNSHAIAAGWNWFTGREERLRCNQDNERMQGLQPQPKDLRHTAIGFRIVLASTNSQILSCNDSAYH